MNAVLRDASECDELGPDRKPKLDSPRPDAEVEERREVYCRTVT
jgi:hypothetical protein